MEKFYDICTIIVIECFSSPKRAYNEALALKKSAEPVNREEVAALLAQIGASYEKQDRTDEALACYTVALAIEKELEHPNAARTAQTIAMLYKRQGKDEEALKAFAELFATGKEALTPADMANSMTNAANIYANQVTLKDTNR